MSDKLERQGPKYGIHFTEDQARQLFRTYTNKDIQSFTPSVKGYNNRIYRVTTTDGANYFIKVGGRYWQRNKTESEVTGLYLAAHAGIPVPRIAYWTSTRDEWRVEVVVLEQCDGVVLSAIWKHLTFAQKKDVFAQLASNVILMHTHVSATDLSLGRIGNFVIEDPADVVASYRVGATLSQKGPWTSYRDYLRDILDGEVARMDSDPIYAPLRALRPRIDAYREKILRDTAYLPDPEKPVFIHGDLSDRNVIVSVSDLSPEATDTDEDGFPIIIPTPQSILRITAILDWEWSGFFPPEEEYFLSFEFLKPLDEDTTEEQREEAKQLGDHFLNILEASGVPTPRTIRGWEAKHAFNEVKEAVAPWWLADLVEPEGEKAKKKLEEAKKELEKWLEKCGC